jgi:hypothetical protein
MNTLDSYAATANWTLRPVDALDKSLRQALIRFMVQRGAPNLDAYPGIEAHAAHAQAEGDLLAQAEHALARMTIPDLIVLESEMRSARVSRSLHQFEYDSCAW